MRTLASLSRGEPAAVPVTANTFAADGIACRDLASDHAADVGSLLCIVLALAWVVGLLGPDALAGDVHAATVLALFSAGPVVGLSVAAWHRHRDRATASEIAHLTAAITLTGAVAMGASAW